MTARPDAQQRERDDRYAVPAPRGAVPAPRARAEPPPEPVGTFPRRTEGRSADGRRWNVLTSAQGAVATTSAGTVAEAKVQETDERVVVEFWTSPALPHELRRRLVTLIFAHPALRRRRPVLVCVPAADSDVLVEAREHLMDAHSRVAGATCLMEGLVQGGPR